MDVIDESNHGKVGEALYVKFTVDKCKEYGLEKYFDIYDGRILSVEELNSTSADCSVPIHVDNSTRGRYECVCEFGTEVYK